MRKIKRITSLIFALCLVLPLVLVFGATPALAAGPYTVWGYDVTYTWTDPDLGDGDDSFVDISTWVVTSPGVVPHATPYYSGMAIQMDIVYGVPVDPAGGDYGTCPLRMKMDLPVYLDSGTIWFDAATQRMVEQVTLTYVGGTPTTVTVQNEWLDDLGMPDKYVAHSSLPWAGSPCVENEFHEVMPPAGPAPVTVPAGTFICVSIDDYLIGEGYVIGGVCYGPGYAVGTGDGSATSFLGAASFIIGRPGEERIVVNGVEQVRGTDYNCNYTTGSIDFTSPPANGAVIAGWFWMSAYSPARLWYTDYIDVTPAPNGAGLVKQVSNMYDYGNGVQTMELTWPYPPIPEWATIALFGAGILGIAGFAGYRKFRC